MDAIKVNEIVIPKAFSQSTPNPIKVDAIREYVERLHKIDSPVVLDGEVLVDGYIRYLVAVEKGLDEVPCVQALDCRGSNLKKKTVVSYVTGKFKHSEKEYTWKNVMNIPVKEGDKILVESNNKVTGTNKGIVIVTKVFQSDNPYLLRHKSVIKNIG